MTERSIAKRNVLLAYLQAHLLTPVDQDRLRDVSELRDVTREIRLLRDDGWQIEVHRTNGTCRLLSLEKGSPRGTAGEMPPTLRMTVLKRDAFRCRACGFGAGEHNDRNKVTRLNVHHVQHRKDNGPHSADNLLTLCEDCHAQTHGLEQ